MKGFNHSAGRSFTTAGGAQVYFEESGDPAGEPMLLLHGGFGNLEEFNPVVVELQKSYRLIAMDSRGQGRSTLGREPLTYKALQQDVEALLEKLNLENLSLFGMSDGGIVAYRLAAFTRLKVEKLITISSRWSGQNALDTAGQMHGVPAAAWRAQFPERVAKYESLNEEADFEKLTAALEHMWMDQTETGSPNEAIAAIKCPPLICKGDADPIIKRQFVVDAANRISNSQLAIIPAASHLIYPEQKEVLLQLVNGFLGS
jgi:pimeloyl-ACP methyl ester carboxylesterase